METNKIVRSICYFTQSVSAQVLDRLNTPRIRLKSNSFEIQTLRICVPYTGFSEVEQAVGDSTILTGVGNVEIDDIDRNMDSFYKSKNVYFHLDLSEADINGRQADVLFRIIREHSDKTFHFAYVFGNPPSSPYFPSARFETAGFSIGLQSTDLSYNRDSIEDWLEHMRLVWQEGYGMFKNETDFLGIDSSIAPMYTDKSSFVSVLRTYGYGLSRAATSQVLVKITEFLKNKNPKPVGLCGLMLPALEDFELAAEYEKGNFTIERNIFLSLQSGLGIDTYPVGVDEDPKRLVEILQLMQALSHKYAKPLSARFVSDGKAKIGEQTDFGNHYLKDVVVRAL
ncbi:hypothetical protein A2154_02165 [Candidatus Gottesmanbacteria bacterium RBG_16_43_7]|uniref:DUF711 domain-containing protein n=1 Tax=Candidatus Gottesmanbacteria bacterium RBG_16_43_7 TaxID=1798373 RepID=A0A1F5Z8S6_9BACT|nr:MAG: hypothetical protein A2154_02165 [Candidatus Gottesmanbacteria bacterium RBG_16_43_7]